jgi:hypothetical protein
MLKPLSGSSGIFPPFIPPSAQSSVDPFQSITHSPMAPMAPIKPFGTAPVSQVGLATPPGLFAPLAEQVSRQDVFFSDQSFRAQLHRYLNVMPSSPWMFAYARQATSSWLDTIFTPRQSVLLITPVSEEDSGENSQGNASQDDAQGDSSEGQGDATDSSRLNTELVDSIDVLDAMDVLDDSDSLDRSSRDSATAEAREQTVLVTETVADSNGKPTRMVVQQLFGHYLDAQHYAQLTEAYEKTKDYPDQCLWVRHFQDHLEILGPQPPYQHGLHQVKRETLQAVMDWVTPFACRYLECYEDDMQLFLPNGGMLPLRPLAWVDGEDRMADVFRVKRMPNGMWFKVESVRRQTAIPIQDVAQIKRTMEEWNQTLEDVGWLRHAS